MNNQDHKIVLAIHPTKSWVSSEWSEKARRWYRAKVRFIYCVYCQTWGWALPPSHSAYPSKGHELKTYRGKLKV